MSIRATSGRRRVGRLPRWLALAAVLTLVFVWPGFRVLLGLGPREVLFVYVREENSLGLSCLPAEGESGTSGLKVAAGVVTGVTLPAASGRVRPGTKVIVLRETFVAGVLVESRAVFVSRLPSLARGRPEGGLLGEDGEYALLGLDLRLAKGAGREGAGSLLVEAVRPEGGALPPGVLLRPGQEWRIGAARTVTGDVTILDAADAGCVFVLREAFAADRPVSVLSVTYYGSLDTNRIERASEIPTG